MQGGVLGLFVGMFPSLAMLFASFILLKVEVEAKTEAMFQNFCAGLMICAVAAELFPLMLDENGETRSVGITVGFALALLVIHGVEHIVKSYEDDDSILDGGEKDSAGARDDHGAYTPPGAPSAVSASASADAMEGGGANGSSSGGVDAMQIHSRTPLSGTSREVSGSSAVGGGADASPATMDKKRYEGLFDEEQVRLSAAAIAHKSHREHIVSHLNELMESITRMGLKTDKLLSNNGLVDALNANPRGDSENNSDAGDGDTDSSATAALLGGHSSGTATTTVQHLDSAVYANVMIEHRPVTPVIKGGKFETHHAEAEALAEDIDEEIHKVQYKLDHCRRLLQGSESGIHHHKPSWLSTARLRDMRSRIDELTQSVAHLLDHMRVAETAPLDSNALQEMYIHMDDMEQQINKFHATVAEHASKWRRSRPFPEIEDGERIPVGLVIPVCIDSFIDGLLIGITVAVSFKAGLILSLANCLEMGFLGMALTSRVIKCTASSLTLRYACILVPPAIMWGAAGLGGWLGAMSQSIPLLFTAVVAFGVTAILHLVCNELLIEARELQGEDPKWWISSTVFFGIYVVLIMDSYIPA